MLFESNKINLLATSTFGRKYKYTGTKYKYKYFSDKYEYQVQQV